MFSVAKGDPSRANPIAVCPIADRVLPDGSVLFSGSNPERFDKVLGDYDAIHKLYRTKMATLGQGGGINPFNPVVHIFIHH